MSERRPSISDPEQLLQLKDDILALWRQLPPEEQTSMSIALLNTVIEGEWGEWMQRATGPDRLFPITGISRADLEQAGVSREEIAQIDDQDMRRIARRVEDHLVNDVFWDELGIAARAVLTEKGVGDKAGAA